MATLEPTTLPLLVLDLNGVLLRRRRKKKKLSRAAKRARRDNPEAASASAERPPEARESVRLRPHALSFVQRALELFPGRVGVWSSCRADNLAHALGVLFASQQQEQQQLAFVWSGERCVAVWENGAPTLRKPLRALASEQQCDLARVVMLDDSAAKFADAEERSCVVLVPQWNGLDSDDCLRPDGPFCLWLAALAATTSSASSSLSAKEWMAANPPPLPVSLCPPPPEQV